MTEQADDPEESFTYEYVYILMLTIEATCPACMIILCTCRQRQEHRVFETLLWMVPGLEECLISRSENKTIIVAEMVRLLLSIYDLILTSSQDSKRRI
jgi:hypothetical protein